MILRSQKQASPPLKLIIEENTKKKALKKRNRRRIYAALKRQFKIQYQCLRQKFHSTYLSLNMWTTLV